MAIINCPGCGKRISSVARSCEYCKMNFTDSVDDEKQLRIARNSRISKIQNLQNYSFLAVMLFATGALVMYLGITDGNETLNSSGRLMLSIGFIGYIFTRVMLFMARRK